jgi:uncharacterized YigZ family protein
MSYNTVRQEGIAEQIVDKSRFIAFVKPVVTREEALAYFDAVKQRHKDATHHVPAMVIGEQYQIQWASDDGEPQGTAGAPLLHMLIKEQITDVAVMVVRYFGGIKLGPGGLIRAYTSTAKLALGAAETKSVQEMVLLTVKIEYPYLQMIENLSSAGEFSIQTCDYSDTVTVAILFPQTEKQRIKNMLSDLTSGSLKIISEVCKNA